VIWPGSAGKIVAFSRGKFSCGEGAAERIIFVGVDEARWKMVGFLRLGAVLAALCLLDSTQPAPGCPQISRLLVPGLGLRHSRRDGKGFKRLRGGKAEEEGWEVPGHAWDQSRSAVKVYIFIPGIGSAWGGAWEDHVSARFEEQSMDVRVEGFPVDGGKDKNYRLKIQLFFPVEAGKCTFSLRADRITVTLPKVANGGLWPKLAKMTRLTLDDIPTLPESFRAEPEEAETSRAGSRAVSVDDGQESSTKKMEVSSSHQQQMLAFPIPNCKPLLARARMRIYHQHTGFAEPVSLPPPPPCTETWSHEERGRHVPWVSPLILASQHASCVSRLREG